MSYEPLHHKYRPQSFGDLVGQSAIAQTLINAISQKKIAPAYLFTGPRGTGKTSSARILAKSLNCLKSEQPTPHPCGKCEVCKAIAVGTALDVIEIDAASNTGVDNIREIIERSQFAPVQSRYKVYAIDECLTGDSLIQTSTGLMRIDDPKLKGEMVLSYNENTETWEYKKVLRWLNQGTKETLIIQTSECQIRCTENHLIRTDKGWIKAKNVKEGMKILSPVNVDVVQASINMARMDEYADLQQDISKEVLQYFFTLRDFLNEKIKLLLTGLQVWDILPVQNLTQENLHKKLTTTLNSRQNLVENGYQICNNTQFPQWTTNLEKVESVRHDGHEKVYDLEVEDNHNFVANGLLVHNCHMLSTAAFNALLKTLEEPPPRVVFILATTDPQRVLPTIISRCQRFDYRRIPLDEMVQHLKYIAQQEQINIDHEAIKLVGQVANGGLRDAESLLDQLSLFPEKITIDQVWDLVGAIPEQDLLILLQEIRKKNFSGILKQCRSLLDRGREPITLLQNLASFYLNLLIAKSAPQSSDLVAVTENCWKKLQEEALQWQQETILWGQQKLKEAETQIKNTTQPRLWLEVTLLGLLSEGTITPLSVTDQSPRQSSITDLNNNNIKSPPTQQVAATRESIEEKPSQLFSESEAEKVSARDSKPDTTTQNTETVKEQPQPVSKTALVTESCDNSPVSASLLSKSSVAEEDNEVIWQKAIAILEPPTTKSLLNQKCHLINLEDSRAVIGVTSPQLLRLLQGKAINIETAFSQVCQRIIKVSLEVADNNVVSKKAYSSSPDEEKTHREVNREIEKTTRQEISSSLINATTTDQPPTSSNIKPETDTKHSLEVKPNSFKNELPPKPETILDATVTPELSIDRNSINQNQLPQNTVVNSSLGLKPKNSDRTSPVSSEAEFDLAVELIAKSFDGEIITLDNYSATEESSSDKSQILEVTESLPPETTTDSDIAISEKKSDSEARDSKSDRQSIIANRPDPSMYDDEDVPFARPINLEMRGLELQDSWEWTVNQPGKWLYRKNYLFK